MEIMNAVFTQVSELANTLFTNALTNGFWFAALGLLGGIFLVIQLNRKKIFNRSHKIWTFLAKINLVYIPVLLMLLLGSGGLVVGLQKTCNQWIDASTQPVVQYANVYLPALQTAAMNMELNSALTLEEMIALELANNQEVPNTAYAEDIMFHYNSAIAGALLEEMGYPSELDEIVKVMRSLDLNQIDNNFFNRIPASIKSYAGNYFFILYKMIFLAFLPFLLIPVCEFGIHRMVNKTTSVDKIHDEDEFV